MVVFTCQHCGDSVKKPGVEKHYSTRCRYKSFNLTCVDCLKDFSAEDYGKHNQCMTELQRYSAKGTAVKEQKGKNKQEKYVMMIQQIIATENLNITPKQKKLLEVCANFDNVPRKPKPFENFIRNVAGRMTNIEDIQSVFKIIEEFSKKVSEPTRIQDEEKDTKQKNTASFPEVGGNDSELTNNNEDLVDGKMKKKKKKLNESLVLNNGHAATSATVNAFDESVCNDTSTNEHNVKQKKVKHKNKSKLISAESFEREAPILNSTDKESTDLKEVTITSNSEVDVPDNIKENIGKLSRKQIKKQKKYEKYLEELESETNIVPDKSQENMETEESHDKKRKKKKKYTPEDDDSKSELKTHGKERKKRKLEDNDAVIPEKKTKEETPSKYEKEPLTAGAFNWGDVIMEVLQSRPDKEISLKKLGKKVINEYQSVNQDHRTYEELLAKFNKKVNKVKGVRVLRDKAQLVE